MPHGEGIINRTVDCGVCVLFPSGTIFAKRFVIIDLLGEGGMGQVYKAKQIGLDRIVALKVLLHEIASRTT